MSARCCNHPATSPIEKIVIEIVAKISIAPNIVRIGCKIGRALRNIGMHMYPGRLSNNIKTEIARYKARALAIRFYRHPVRGKPLTRYCKYTQGRPEDRVLPLNRRNRRAGKDAPDGPRANNTIVI